MLWLLLALVANLALSGRLPVYVGFVHKSRTT